MHLIWNHQCPHYPFHERVLNRWVTVKTHPNKSEHGNSLQISIINTTLENAYSLTFKGSRFPPDDPQSKYWYHGISHDDTLKIMDQIRLNKSKKGLDFFNGFGFYLSKVCGYAVTLGKDKKSDVGVLIFDMTKPYKFKELDLSEWEKNWKMFLTFNASIKFMQNHPPGTRLEGSKNPPHWDKTGIQKPHPWNINSDTI